MRRPKLARIVETANTPYGSFDLYTLDADGANHRRVQTQTYFNRAEREYAKRMIVIFAENEGYQFARP